MPLCHPRTWCLLLLGSLPFQACSCEEEPLTPALPGSCEPTYQCPLGFEYKNGDCRQAGCVTDAECCPGQECNAAVRFCADQYVTCTTDDECAEVPGMACIETRGGRYCGYPNRGRSVNAAGTQSCASQADCDSGRTCFSGRCLVFAPCNGGCPSGEICDLDTNTCWPMDDCTASCTEGQILVVGDQDLQSGPSCCKVECKCETLPPVRPGQFGWYASLALAGDEVVVGAYDPVYGDLVVARYDQASLLQRLDYVDGFPLAGPIVANPNGARGGRSEPGPVVGEHVSVAVDAAGAVHAAYYDRTNHQLRYASNSGGMWKSSLVDAEGDVGLYTSIAIGPDGNPHVAYFMAEGTVAPDPAKRSALKFASARVPQPQGPSDWTVSVVDSALLPIPPCNGGCMAGSACVDQGMGPSCVGTVTGCTPTCATNEACVMDGAAAACLEKVSLVEVDDLVPGTGLFASLAFTATATPVIAYYDRQAGDLRLAEGTGGGNFRLRTVDGADPLYPFDVGQHVSLAVGPQGILGLAYFDATNDDLVYLQVEGSRLTREVVDNGVTPPDLRLVGADASLIFDELGQPAIAYQDPTLIDLLYARRAAGTWSTEILRGGIPPGQMEGTASGFYPSQKRRGNTAFITNVDVGFDLEGKIILNLSVLKKELL